MLDQMTERMEVGTKPMPFFRVSSNLATAWLTQEAQRGPRFRGEVNVIFFSLQIEEDHTFVIQMRRSDCICQHVWLALPPLPSQRCVGPDLLRL